MGDRKHPKMKHISSIHLFISTTLAMPQVLKSYFYAQTQQKRKSRVHWEII